MAGVVAWMVTVLYIGFCMLDTLDYMAESSDYEIQLLDLIYGELEPVGDLGLISRGRSFHCTVDYGLTNTYN
jgi:hypothetical protein